MISLFLAHFRIIAHFGFISFIYTKDNYFK
jgi:hypothetical protein